MKMEFKITFGNFRSTNHLRRFAKLRLTWKIENFNSINKPRYRYVQPQCGKHTRLQYPVAVTIDTT